MKVLALVFSVAVVALLIGVFSPGVEAPTQCSGSCAECATYCQGLGSPAQCYSCCVGTGCPDQPSFAICYMGECEAEAP